MKKALLILLMAIIFVSCGEKAPQKPLSVKQFEEFRSFKLDYEKIYFDSDMNKYLVYTNEELNMTFYVENVEPYDIHYGTCYGLKVWENGTVVEGKITSSEENASKNDNTEKSYIKPDTWYQYSSNNVVHAQNA